MPKGVKNSGLSTVRTEYHTFKASGKWFHTEEEAREYSDRLNLLRRAKRAGFGITPQELERFAAAEKLQLAEIKRAAELKQREKDERDRIREEHGLHPKAHVSGLAATAVVREQGRKYLAKANRERMSDSERLDSIRRLYRQRHKMSPTDLLIQVGRLVGEL